LRRGHSGFFAGSSGLASRSPASDLRRRGSSVPPARLLDLVHAFRPFPHLRELFAAASSPVCAHPDIYARCFAMIKV
jgi:hypothetical protein